MRIVDAHTHIRDRSGESAPLFELASRLGYDRFAVQSLQCTGSLLQNFLCAALKLRHPDTVYAFGGLEYRSGLDFRTQGIRLREAGFDGMKMLEGKPNVHKQLQTALDDPKYDDCYSYFEETGFPVVLHVADPPEFWDMARVPSWALERGWFYDETHVPYERHYEEVEGLLSKHPKLRAVFAHFFFLSGDPERAQRFLDAHPSVFLDVTAGIEMYENFSKDPAFWREFFMKNAHRIVFGTDSVDTRASDDPDGEVDLAGYAGMEIEFLKSDRDITIYGKKLWGIGLPVSAQERIFHKNFESLVGEAPKRMDRAALIAEADRLAGYIEDEADAAALRGIVAFLKGEA